MLIIETKIRWASNTSILDPLKLRFSIFRQLEKLKSTKKHIDFNRKRLHLIPNFLAKYILELPSRDIQILIITTKIRCASTPKPFALKHHGDICRCKVTIDANTVKI